MTLVQDLYNSLQPVSNSEMPLQTEVPHPVLHESTQHQDISMDMAMDIDNPPPSQFLASHPPISNVPSTSTTTTIPNQWQSTLQLSGTLAVSQKIAVDGPAKQDRCAVCVKQYCTERFRCPGKGSRKLCSCSHPPLAQGEKVRITEDAIKAYHLKAQKTQN